MKFELNEKERRGKVGGLEVDIYSGLDLEDLLPFLYDIRMYA